jgi:cytochrome c-type biogenesis protein
MGWLENLNGISRFRRGFEIAGGVTLIFMGFYMLNAVMLWIPELAI